MRQRQRTFGWPLWRRRPRQRSRFSIIESAAAAISTAAAEIFGAAEADALLDGGTRGGRAEKSALLRGWGSVRDHQVGVEDLSLSAILGLGCWGRDALWQGRRDYTSNDHRPSSPRRQLLLCLHRDLRARAEPPSSGESWPARSSSGRVEESRQRSSILCDASFTRRRPRPAAQPPLQYYCSAPTRPELATRADPPYKKLAIYGHSRFYRRTTTASPSSPRRQPSPPPLPVEIQISVLLRSSGPQLPGPPCLWGRRGAAGPRAAPGARRTALSH